MRLKTLQIYTRGSTDLNQCLPPTADPPAMLRYLLASFLGVECTGNGSCHALLLLLSHVLAMAMAAADIGGFQGWLVRMLSTGLQQTGEASLRDATVMAGQDEQRTLRVMPGNWKVPPALYLPTSRLTLT